MNLMLISSLIVAAVVASMIYEPRSFWKALALLFSLGLLLIAMAMSPGITTYIVTVVVILIPLAFVFMSVFLIINGIIMIKKEGWHPSSVLSLGLGLFMSLGSKATAVGLIELQDPTIARSVFYLGVLLECYIAFTFIALLFYSTLYTFIPKRIKCDYIIVHGCGLTDGERVSPLLRGRVDKAVRVYNKAKKARGFAQNAVPKLVVSGGMGSDEKLSEAQAMWNYLEEIGFPMEDVIMEDKSTTTYENLANVKKMLDVDGIRHRYIFVTNNYHVFRTGLFARKLKMRAAGVGCRTAAYYWPSAFIREYIAIMVKYKWVALGVVALWAALVLIFKL